MRVPTLPFEAAHCVAVGSRVTCSPAPTDTDEDFLVFVPGEPNEVHALIDRPLTEAGWDLGGSLPTDMQTPIESHHRFWSYTRGDQNLIITASEPFYARFLAATAVAKRLNLLSKDDRIALFQAVLYGAAA